MENLKRCLCFNPLGTNKILEKEEVRVSFSLGISSQGLSLQLELDCKLLALYGSLIPSYDFREKVEYSGKTIVEEQKYLWKWYMNVAPGNWHDMSMAKHY